MKRTSRRKNRKKYRTAKTEANKPSSTYWKEKGLEIIRGMRGFTSGIAIPTFVVDGLDGQGKVPLQPDYVVAVEKDYVVLKGYKGEEFKYYNPEEVKKNENRVNV